MERSHGASLTAPSADVKPKTRGAYACRVRPPVKRRVIRVVVVLLLLAAVGILGVTLVQNLTRDCPAGTSPGGKGLCISNKRLR